MYDVPLINYILLYMSYYSTTYLLFYKLVHTIYTVLLLHMMDQVAGHKSSKKFTTPSGIEWIYLTSASDGTELEEIRRNNQVHYNSYSEKNAWTKFVCNRNPKTNGNCKYQLLAIKKSAAENPSFNIYWRGVHNHDVIPIKSKPSSAEQGSSTGTEKRHPRSTQKTLAFVIVHRDNPTPSINGSSTNNAEGEETSGPSSDDSNIALHSICYSYHELENLRRTEGLLIDEQFNVVDGLPEKAFYRCKANTKCPYSLKAYHNKVAGFFEVYAPHPNLHEHNNSDITMTKIKYNKSGQHSHNHAGIGIKEEGDMNKGNGVADPVYSKSALHLRNQEQDIEKRGSHGVNITKSKNAGRKRQATLSFPRNVDIRQWNFVCDLADDAQFERLRKAKRVVSLKQMGKTFCTLRQQTLKCYRRSSLKGKCPYRILLFRIGAVVKLYEKGAHNHFVPAPSEEYDIPLVAQKKAHGNREMDSIEIGSSVVPEPEEIGHSSLRKRRKFSVNSNIESLL